MDRASGKMRCKGSGPQGGLIEHVYNVLLIQVPRPTHSLVHTTLASSACTQSCWPTGLLEHWKRVLSVPKQATLSSQIGPAKGGGGGRGGWQEI